MNPLIQKLKSRLAQKLGVKPQVLDFEGWETEDVIEWSKFFFRESATAKK